MRVLIVDDEPIVRESMSELLPWKEMGFETVLCARDAYDAQKELELERIDVLISDIEMPGMDGLALSKWVHERSPRTVILLLTCHASFSYAQSAIRYGVMDYLLKPVIKTDLEQCVQKAIRLIQEENKKIETENEAYHWKKNKPYIMESLWHDVLVYHLDDEHLIQQRAHDMVLQLNAEERYIPILFETRGKPTHEVMRIISQLSFFEKEKDNCVWGCLDENKMYCIISKADTLTEKHLQCFLQEKSIFEKSEICCVLGDTVYASGICEMFSELIALLETNIAENLSVLQWKKNWRQEKIEVIELPLFGNLQKQSESLESYGRKLVDWLNCDKIRSKIQKRDLERFQSGFEQVLFAYLKERNIDLFSILSTGGLNKQKQQATSGLKMMSLYVSRLLEVTEQSIRKQYDRNPVVEQIKAYIELNYEKEINRKDLSALVFLNPDYMDRVFKEQEGISVNRYINKVRMEKAQLLLEKTQMQVLEIADKVGYSSLSNFNMQFKQYCGLSPNQYRKRIRNRQNVEIQ